MPFDHAKNITKLLEDQLRITWRDPPRDEDYQYNCKVLYDSDRRYEAECTTQYARSFSVMEIIDKNNDVVTYELEPFYKTFLHALEFECNNSKNSRKKCSVEYERPTFVKKIKRDAYTTKYSWDHIERVRPTMYIFRIGIKQQKGKIAKVIIGDKDNPNWRP